MRGMTAESIVGTEPYGTIARALSTNIHTPKIITRERKLSMDLKSTTPSSGSVFVVQSDSYQTHTYRICVDHRRVEGRNPVKDSFHTDNRSSWKQTSEKGGPARRH